jgi:hypothetical protein
MSTYDQSDSRDKSWASIVFIDIPAIVFELLKGVGDIMPSKKQEKQPRGRCHWLSPPVGPGAGHNPS